MTKKHYEAIGAAISSVFWQVSRMPCRAERIAHAATLRSVAESIADRLAEVNGVKIDRRKFLESCNF